MTANEGRDMGEFEVWQLAHKKKVVKNGDDPYYGTTTDKLEEYKTRFIFQDHVY